MEKRYDVLRNQRFYAFFCILFTFQRDRLTNQTIIDIMNILQISAGSRYEPLFLKNLLRYRQPLVRFLHFSGFYSYFKDIIELLNTNQI